MSHLEFKLFPRPVNRKTDQWSVLSKYDHSIIGVIAWYAPWRQYVLAPNPETVWSQDCLAEATTFILERMADRRAPPASPAGRPG